MGVNIDMGFLLKCNFCVSFLFSCKIMCYLKKAIYIFVSLYTVFPLTYPLGGGVSRVQAFLFLKLDPFPSIVQYT